MLLKNSPLHNYIYFFENHKKNSFEYKKIIKINSKINHAQKPNRFEPNRNANIGGKKEREKKKKESSTNLLFSIPHTYSLFYNTVTNAFSVIILAI